MTKKQNDITAGRKLKKDFRNEDNSKTGGGA